MKHWIKGTVLGVLFREFYPSKKGLFCQKGRWLFVSVVLACLLVMGIQVNLGCRGRALDWMMRKFHLSTDSLGHWTVFQLVPSMYNFSNQVWVQQVGGMEEESWGNRLAEEGEGGGKNAMSRLLKKGVPWSLVKEKTCIWLDKKGEVPRVRMAWLLGDGGLEGNRGVIGQERWLYAGRFNHYPSRMVTFMERRSFFGNLKENEGVNLLWKSSYQGRELWSLLEVKKQGGQLDWRLLKQKFWDERDSINGIQGEGV